VLINRALKIRIYPTQEQSIQINKTLGCARFIYNQMLAERIAIYEDLKDDRDALYKYKYKTEKEYKENFEWLKEADSKALQYSRRYLEIAYTNFYKSLKGLRKGSKIGFPKFKKKKNSYSYTTIQSVDFNFEKSLIQLPKLKQVKFSHKSIKPWYLTAIVKSATVSRTTTGKYFVSVLFEGEQDWKGYQEITEKQKVIGLDMSMDKFYVDNLGNSPEYKRLNRINESKIAKLNKRFSRKTSGSKNKEKARLRLARVYEIIKNQRSDFTHKLSHKLIKENDVVVIENLSIKGMSQALNLGKSVMDLGYSEFVRQLHYKALWNDKTVITADKWFASSKLCSTCGYKNKDLLLQEREWECKNCGKHNHRDTNAAQNLVKYYVGQELPELKFVEKMMLKVASMKQEIINES